VRLERWAPGARTEAEDLPGGLEAFVLDGALSDAAGTYPKGSWLRLPPGDMAAFSSPERALVYVKTGHLAALVPAE
jgi:hypothetical protein